MNPTEMRAQFLLHDGHLDEAVFSAMQADLEEERNCALILDKLMMDDSHDGIAGKGSYADAVLGEWYVYSFLRRAVSAGTLSWLPGTDWDVVWANEEVEQGLPYDVILSRSRPGRDGGRLGEKEILYCEVKSTMQAHKRAFEISLPELEWARVQGSAYLIVRIFLAPTDQQLPDQSGEPTPRIVIVREPWRLIERKGADLLVRF
uniref:Protein NO VEIN C-terminal domain-containing protein n=1 Tax=Octactis speculum TaxID=3111310 RepID=A0A7S2FZY2_9STRA